MKKYLLLFEVALKAVLNIAEINEE